MTEAKTEGPIWKWAAKLKVLLWFPMLFASVQQADASHRYLRFGVQVVCIPSINKFEFKTEAIDDRVRSEKGDGNFDGLFFIPQGEPKMVRSCALGQHRIDVWVRRVELPGQPNHKPQNLSVDRDWCSEKSHARTRGQFQIRVNGSPIKFPYTIDDDDWFVIAPCPPKQREVTALLLRRYGLVLDRCDRGPAYENSRRHCRVGDGEDFGKPIND